MKTIKVEIERKELREIITTLEISLLYVIEESRTEEIKKIIAKLWEQY